VVSSDQTARQADIPIQFASNILGQLAKAGLLIAHRGNVRGYSLSRPAAEITLIEVIEAYDGPFVKPWCFMDRARPCSETNPCPLHCACHKMHAAVRGVLSGISVAEIHELPQQTGNTPC